MNRYKFHESDYCEHLLIEEERQKEALRRHYERERPGQEVTGKKIIFFCSKVLAIAVGGAALVYFWFKLPF